VVVFIKFELKKWMHPKQKRNPTDLIKRTVSRDPAIDCIRAISMLYVIGITHLDDYASSLFQSKLDDVLTYLSLGAFVYISGHLLTFRTSLKTPRWVIAFLKKRFLRIYPLYILTLLIFCIFSWISIYDFLRCLFLLDRFFNQ